VPYNTVPVPSTPWAAPGTYTVKLTVNGRSYTQPITVRADPRVKTPPLVMQEVYTLTKDMYFGAVDAQAAVLTLATMRTATAERAARAQGAVKQALMDFDRKAEALQGAAATGGRGAAGGRAGGRGAGPGGEAGGPVGRAGAAAPGGAATTAPETLSAAGAALSGVMNSLQGADVQPTALQLAAITNARQLAARVMARWNALKTTDLAALDATLKSAGLETIAVK
jgi:hypothetical protein